MSNTEQGIFINGRQQIIEMLQYMNEEEKQKLLGNIKQKNAVMARELSEQSFSFRSLFKLDQDTLRQIFSRTSPAIIALSLYPLEAKFQRKALGVLERAVAEEAYGLMTQNLSSKKTECRRAQDKIAQIAIQLSRQKSIRI